MWHSANTSDVTSSFLCIALDSSSFSYTCKVRANHDHIASRSQFASNLMEQSDVAAVSCGIMLVQQYLRAIHLTHESPKMEKEQESKFHKSIPKRKVLSRVEGWNQ